MPYNPEAFFLASARGPLFCVFHPPIGDAVRGRVLHFHPFAEELNTCRRVSAQCARALAQAGYAVMQFDLWGCGDSAGEFEQASWHEWVDNARAALCWMDERLVQLGCAPSPLWFWGVRGGALLASRALHLAEETVHLLLWQPCGSGRQLLQQLQRTQTASQWLGTAPAGQPQPRQAREPWSDGHHVTIAGYTISAGLAEALGEARLIPPGNPRVAPGHLVWLEAGTTGEAGFGPGSHRQMELWSSQGWDISSARVRGPTFWHSISDEDAPELLHASRSHLQITESTR